MPQFDSSNFWVVNWYYIVAVLISLSGLIIAIKNYKSKKGSKEQNIPTANSQPLGMTNTQSNPITIYNEVTYGTTKKEIQEKSSINEDKNKANVRILFIDDKHTDYKMVSILKKAGWINTKSVKDIVDLDHHMILEADIIFVDINGVGTTMFEDQGLGLASALKSRHPKKKVVIYSAETTGDRFHKALRQVDDCLAKDAEPYQFIELVESLSRK